MAAKTVRATVPPLDGKILGTLVKGPRTIDQITESLKQERGAIVPAIRRMAKKGLVEVESIEGGERLVTAR